MLLKKNRATKKDIDILFKKGNLINSPHFTFRFILNNKNYPSISFIVPKSVAKLAVKRNKLRRLGCVVLEKYINKFPPLFGVFVFKKYQDDISIIEDEIKNILKKIN